MFQDRLATGRMRVGRPVPALAPETARCPGRAARAQALLPDPPVDQSITTSGALTPKLCIFALTWSAISTEASGPTWTR